MAAQVELALLERVEVGKGGGDEVGREAHGRVRAVRAADAVGLTGLEQSRVVVLVASRWHIPVLMVVEVLSRRKVDAAAADWISFCILSSHFREWIFGQTPIAGAAVVGNKLSPARWWRRCHRDGNMG